MAARKWPKALNRATFGKILKKHQVLLVLFDARKIKYQPFWSALGRKKEIENFKEPSWSDFWKNSADFTSPGCVLDLKMHGGGKSQKRLKLEKKRCNTSMYSGKFLVRNIPKVADE